jgi:hypothetical protein
VTDVIAGSALDELRTRLTEEPVVAFAETMAGQVRGWYSRAVAALARFEVCPKQTLDSYLPNGWVIDKERVRVMLSWPTTEPRQRTKRSSKRT